MYFRFHLNETFQWKEETINETERNKTNIYFLLTFLAWNKKKNEWFVFRARRVMHCVLWFVSCVWLTGMVPNIILLDGKSHFCIYLTINVVTTHKIRIKRYAEIVRLSTRFTFVVRLIRSHVRTGTKLAYCQMVKHEKCGRFMKGKRKWNIFIGNPTDGYCSPQLMTIKFNRCDAWEM